MSETREIPPKIQAASRRLSGNEDIATLIQWVAEEHGIGSEEFEPDSRLSDFKTGQRRSITFLAELAGVDLLLVRGMTLKAEKPKTAETDETKKQTDE